MKWSGDGFLTLLSAIIKPGNMKIYIFPEFLSLQILNDFEL